MSNEFAEATLYKIATGNYTPEELSAFLQALEELDERAFVTVYNKLYEIAAQQEPGAIDEPFRASLEEKLNQLPSGRTPVQSMHARTQWIKWVAAAAVVLLITGAAYWFTTKNTSVKPVPVATKTTIPINRVPGGNHATLTLSNGAVIVLDEAKEGDVAQQGGSRIVKANSGQLVYYPAASGNTPIEYNTITTPRAGQYHIILPDGTHVWLNAASSLRFPTTFSGKTREVQVSGEGYFEVAHDKTKPFYVSKGAMQVQVLGTHFNVNAYDDEEVVKVTLLEGSVKIGKEEFVMLKPGEQAIALVSPLTTDHSPRPDDRVGRAFTINHSPDLQQVIAWKNGFFEFNNMSLPAIMRQISRWYDVDVSLEADYPEKRFGGRISRKLNLSNIISVLETYGVHFKMENRKLIVVQ